MRHRVDSLSCDLGDVVDLSTVGMRVLTAGRPPLGIGQSGRIKLRTAEGTLALTGRVVWVRRRGFRKFAIGVEFLNVKRSMTAALDRLARFGFVGFGDPEVDMAEANRKARTRVRASIDLPDYYGILGLDPHADDEDIREAFRQIARKYHPDVSDDPDGEMKFARAQEAYEVLKDAQRRKVYDRKRAV